MPRLVDGTAQQTDRGCKRTNVIAVAFSWVRRRGCVHNSLHVAVAVFPARRDEKF